MAMEVLEAYSEGGQVVGLLEDHVEGLPVAFPLAADRIVAGD